MAHARGTVGSRKRRTLARLLLACGVLGWGAGARAAAPGPTYVGRAACASCHPVESERWAGSHHDRAMQQAGPSTVLGDFANATFTYAGVTSRFFRKGDAYWVRTDGADGKLHEYRIAYTFGVDPLQQYLIELPGGRLQALGICWDTRPKAEGGQRWFHLYPDEKVAARDVLHWTGPAQNWNFMCAECHSTGVQKNYRVDQERFESRWAEIDVSCEACHGPASAHVAWARTAGASGSPVPAPSPATPAPADPSPGGAPPSAARPSAAPPSPAPRGAAVDAARGAADATKGLVVALRGAADVAWVRPDDARTAHQTPARDRRAQLEVCGRCHARRAQISEDYRQDQPLAQTHLVAFLDEGLYEADGQILDEVYEYGSFLQSRMYANGVACTDCHDPHSGRLRAAGNALCTTCHAADAYDVPAHHHHAAAGEGARCVACHMPARTYMVVHRRHDHGFRVPRPDLSVSLGTPNACADCHRDRPPAWAADAIVGWFGATRARGPRWAEAIAAGRRRQAGGDALLAAVIGDAATPAIVRATAVGLLGRFPGARMQRIVETELHDADPLARRAAVALLPAWEPQRRWALGAPLLEDPIRTVRLEAVSALADVAAVLGLASAQRATFDVAATEYRAVQRFDADRADAWLNLGALAARLGSLDEAEADYRRAIRLQPSFQPSYVNLADLYRQSGRDADAERVLRDALTRQPGSADAHYALGLTLVRRGRRADALGEFAAAVRHAPDEPRYVYVYAVALEDAGKRAEAIALLEDAHRRFSGDRQLLTALAQMTARAGDDAAAARWTAELRALDGTPPAGP